MSTRGSAKLSNSIYHSAGISSLTSLSKPQCPTMSNPVAQSKSVSSSPPLLRASLFPAPIRALLAPTHSWPRPGPACAHTRGMRGVWKTPFRPGPHSFVTYWYGKRSRTKQTQLPIGFSPPGSEFGWTDPHTRLSRALGSTHHFGYLIQRLHGITSAVSP